MRTTNTLINDVAKFLTNFGYLQEFLTHPYIRTNNLTDIHEIAEKLVDKYNHSLNSEDFNKNYDKILELIKCVIMDYCAGY